MSKNDFCKRSNLTNEASVENWFVDRLLAYLGFDEDDILVKTSIREFKVGQGARASLYKPDYIVTVNGFPTVVVDAKHPEESIDDWTSQCSSYCLELNKLYEYNPVEYFVLTNGLSTKVYKWDRAKPLVELSFEDFTEGNEALSALKGTISKDALKGLDRAKREDLMESPFELRTISLDEMASIFTKLHKHTWETEKKTPSAAFQELMKIVFIKIKKDRELRKAIGPSGAAEGKGPDLFGGMDSKSNGE